VDKEAEDCNGVPKLQKREEYKKECSESLSLGGGGESSRGRRLLEKKQLGDVTDLQGETEP